MKFKLTCEANPGPVEQWSQMNTLLHGFLFFFFANSVFFFVVFFVSAGVLIALWLMLLIMATGHLGF